LRIVTLTRPTQNLRRFVKESDWSLVLAEIGELNIFSLLFCEVFPVTEIFFPVIVLVVFAQKRLRMLGFCNFRR